jgi:hypothetical protein
VLGGLDAAPGAASGITELVSVLDGGELPGVGAGVALPELGGVLGGEGWPESGSQLSSGP